MSWTPISAVVAAYGLILPKPILEAPRGCINVHASLLPRWRGAAPIQRAILGGDEDTGITLMQMDEGLDTGPTLLEWQVEIDGKTAGQLTEELAERGAQALWHYLAEPQNFPPISQPPEGVTYAQKVDKAEARLDFIRDAYEVERQVRAFNPVPGAWFEFMGERMKVWEAEVLPEARPAGMVARQSPENCLRGASYSCHCCPAPREIAHEVDELLRGFPIPEGTQS